MSDKLQIVVDNQTGFEVLVAAKSSAAALRHVIKDRFTSRRAKDEDTIRIMQAGGKIQTAEEQGDLLDGQNETALDVRPTVQGQLVSPQPEMAKEPVPQAEPTNADDTPFAGSTAVHDSEGQHL